MRAFVFAFLIGTNPCEQLGLLVKNNSGSFCTTNFKRISKICISESHKIPCIIPIKNLSSGKISSGYGNRFHPVLKTFKHHGGIDIACSDTIIVAADGIVEKVDYSITLGKYVVVNHQNGYITKYGHLSKVLVFEGETLKLGAIIGIAGSTGLATGNHLHYIITKNNKEINPVDYLLLYYENSSKAL
jgi:murein DD-endopeptidase MepM/ murein hydrolase activator NlpD